MCLFLRSKCIDEPIVRAKAVSENLQQCAQRICFLHLQEFLQRFVVLLDSCCVHGATACLLRYFG